MKTLSLTTLAALLLLPFASAQNPRVLQDPSAAISYARTNKQPLILFALLDGSDQGSRNFATLLNDNKLKMKGEEFVVVLCSSSESKNQALFAKNFEQKVDVLPAVVVTNLQGKPMVPGLNGVQVQDDYDRMIHASLVEAGLRSKDEPVISSTTGEVLEGSSKVFRIMKEDVAVGAVVITEYRDWALKNGEKFHGALLKADGANGVFLLDSGDEKNVNFNDLTPDDIVFLQNALSN